MGYHSGMSEQARQRRISPWIVWPTCLLVFVVLYLGSLGPFVWLEAQDQMSVAIFDLIYETVYFLIDWIDENTPFFYEHPAGEAYVSYLRWFD